MARSGSSGWRRRWARKASSSGGGKHAEQAEARSPSFQQLVWLVGAQAGAGMTAQARSPPERWHCFCRPSHLTCRPESYKWSVVQAGSWPPSCRWALAFKGASMLTHTCRRCRCALLHCRPTGQPSPRLWQKHGAGWLAVRHPPPAACSLHPSCHAVPDRHGSWPHLAWPCPAGAAVARRPAAQPAAAAGTAVRGQRGQLPPCLQGVAGEGDVAGGVEEAPPRACCWMQGLPCMVQPAADTCGLHAAAAWQGR